MTAAAETYWRQLPLGRGVTLLVHDANGVVALAKPAGILSHPNERADEPRSLLTAGYDSDGEYFEWVEPADSGASAEPRRLWLLNRLDAATSGVILAAADAKLAAEIRAEFRRKQVRKVYQALVFGIPRQPIELWRDRLAVDRRGGVIRTAAMGNIPAESRMSLTRASSGGARLALLKLEPRTGRSHQLRVQCAKRGLPIVGDQTYGDFAANREFAKSTGLKRMFLHSIETTFEYEWAGQRCKFSAVAPLPPEFLQFV